MFEYAGKPEGKRRIGIKFGLLYIFILSFADEHVVGIMTRN